MLTLIVTLRLMRCVSGMRQPEWDCLVVGEHLKSLVCSSTFYPLQKSTIIFESVDALCSTSSAVMITCLSQAAILRLIVYYLRNSQTHKAHRAFGGSLSE